MNLQEEIKKMNKIIAPLAPEGWKPQTPFHEINFDNLPKLMAMAASGQHPGLKEFILLCLGSWLALVSTYAGVENGPIPKDLELHLYRRILSESMYVMEDKYKYDKMARNAGQGGKSDQASDQA